MLNNCIDCGAGDPDDSGDARPCEAHEHDYCHGCEATMDFQEFNSKGEAVYYCKQCRKTQTNRQ